MDTKLLTSDLQEVQIQIEECGETDLAEKLQNIIDELRLSNRLEKLSYASPVSSGVQTTGCLPIKFKLYDKDKKHIGNEYHEANEFGVIQIYHESLRDDFNDNERKLVREGYYIPHFYKVIE